MKIKYTSVNGIEKVGFVRDTVLNAVEVFIRPRDSTGYVITQYLVTDLDGSNAVLVSPAKVTAVILT